MALAHASFTPELAEAIHRRAFLVVQAVAIFARASTPPSCVSTIAKQRWRVMNPKRTLDPQDQPGRQDVSTTLGDLLYADRSPSISEQDWVRLVAAIAGGDQRALRSLYERSHRLVFTLAMRICNQRELAEEVTVDVFHDVWRRSREFDPTGGSVLGWIMNQARSRAIDRVRFEHRQKRHAPMAAGDSTEARVPANLEEAHQRRRVLSEALATLTPDERQAIETSYFSQLTYSETAARLDQPLGTIKTRVRSALAKLRKALGVGGENP